LGGRRGYACKDLGENITVRGEGSQEKLVKCHLKLRKFGKKKGKRGRNRHGKGDAEKRYGGRFLKRGV